MTIVEFMDYRCSFCRRAHPEVMDLLEFDGNIRLIVEGVSHPGRTIRAGLAFCHRDADRAG